MSKFVVSARKYRPTIFEDVVGQNHIAKVLQNALQTNQLAHSFLFTGPRGVGKTTCARILAKVINCLTPVNKVEPCNTCASCKAFGENASFNIFELDAASNNSVDHIRTLIEQVRYQPQVGSYKVFIIDEVHMLSSSAFNAFLKTLEEPPAHAIFILATTEKHKIIPTILSRCQIFDFKRIQPSDIVFQLKKICKEENRQAEEEALHQIALKADGGMRDALSIFDKISGSSGDIITYNDVITNLNILDYDYYFKMVDAFLRSDLPGSLMLLDEVVKNGFEIETFIEGLNAHMRDLLISKDVNTIKMMETTDAIKSRYFNQSAFAKEAFLLTSMNILNTCDITMNRTNNKRLHTEIALSKIVYAFKAYETDFLAAPSEQIKKKMIP
jgi:DNA polymerase III subunit gamma/tau